jgi:hypothetical protein
MRTLISIIVLCLIFINILPITSAFDLLNMFRRAVGITNQSSKYQTQSLSIKPNSRQDYFTNNFDSSNERYDSCRCCS